MKARLATLIVAAAVAISTAGCFLWPHKESPQQQYTEALMRGNSMQASQIWLNMSAEDRLKFARGEGTHPDEASKDDIKKQIMNHYEDNMEGGAGGDEQMQQQLPTPLGASLKDLPAAVQSSSPNN